MMSLLEKRKLPARRDPWPRFARYVALKEREAYIKGERNFHMSQKNWDRVRDFNNRLKRCQENILHCLHFDK